MKQDGMMLKEWLSLLGVTAAAFIFNTSEFMPIGLLTDIAGDFQMTEAHAGMLITAYSWVVTLLSLPLMLLVCRVEYKRLLLITIFLFGICQIGSAYSSSYEMLMLSRIGVACAHSVFWSVASPIAVRVVAVKHRSLALSTIVTGTSIAMIFGLPLGRMIGLSIGWRMTFFCVAVLALVVLVYLLIVFPKITSNDFFSLQQLPKLLQNRLLLGIYLLTFLLVTAHYTGYSYIEPFLQQVAQLSNIWITIVLMAFGAAGILGSILFSRYYDKNQNLFIKSMLFNVVISLLLLLPMAHNTYTILCLCMFWGMSMTAYNVAFQAETIQCTSQAASPIAMAIYSAIFNLGIGAGTGLGGAVCTYASVAEIGLVGGIVAILAMGYGMGRLLKILRE